ncbi:MAG: hypothetical protein ABI054_12570, partial [Planctomycetota bacterium]
MRSMLFRSAFALATVCSAMLATTTTASAQWTAGAGFPGTGNVRGQGAWFPGNGRLYVMGGRSADTVGSDLQSPAEYDPIANTWVTKTAVFPTNQVCNMSGGLLSDAGTPYIYCVGGSAAGAATSTPTVRRYDPITDTISVVTTDPWPAPANTLPGSGAVVGNKLYVLGGFTIGVSMTDQIWEFDPAAAAGSRWTLKTAVLPAQLGYVPVAAIGNLIYVGGGSLLVAGVPTDSTNSCVYDTVTDTVTAIATIPRATGETRAVNKGGSMWVLGGGRVLPNPSNEVDAYDPGSNTWSLAPAFVLPRRNFATDIDPATGNVYIVGGYAPSTATTSVEIFNGCPAPTTYCTAKLNSLSCLPSIGST